MKSIVVVELARNWNFRVILTAVDMIGEYSSFFCNVRPAGHHAFREKGGGFCVFNNVAIGSLYYLKKHPEGRVMIVDWDVHHGNGTQSIVKAEDRILFVSFHSGDIYPGTGKFDIQENKIYNHPLSLGDDYVEEFKGKTRDLFKSFQPTILFISCGFDAAWDDPLGNLCLSPEDFSEMTRHVKSFGIPIISVLEGGYNLKSLSECCEAHFRAL